MCIVWSVFPLLMPINDVILLLQRFLFLLKLMNRLIFKLIPLIYVSILIGPVVLVDNMLTVLILRFVSRIFRPALLLSHKATVRNTKIVIKQ